jgi:hypothetical protein
MPSSMLGERITSGRGHGQMQGLQGRTVIKVDVWKLLWDKMYPKLGNSVSLFKLKTWKSSKVHA